jgi:hypothetical protein
MIVRIRLVYCVSANKSNGHMNGKTRVFRTKVESDRIGELICEQANESDRSERR